MTSYVTEPDTEVDDPLSDEGGTLPPRGDSEADTMVEDLTGARSAELPHAPRAWIDLVMLGEFTRTGSRHRLTRFRRGDDAEVVVKASADPAGERVQAWQDWTDRRDASPDSGMVPLVRWTHENGVSFVEMPWYPSRSLRDHLNLGTPYAMTLTPSELQTVVRRVDAAIHRLSEPRPLVHRDIKPSNILVTLTPFDVVLADMECLTPYAPIGAAPVFRGTLAYTAPEARGGDISRATDHWSLGITLAQLGTGHHPLENTQGRLITERAIRERQAWNLSIRPGLDPRTTHLVRGLLQPEKADRFGHRQVEAWLKGDYPPLPEAPAAGGGPVGEPGTEGYPEEFYVAGQRVTGLNQLAQLLQENWDAGLRLLAGRDSGELLSWLTRTDGNAAQRVRAVVDAQISGAISADAALTEAILGLQPTSEPYFRGVLCTRLEVSRLVDRALSDAPGELDILHRFLQGGVLEVLADYQGQEWARPVAERWSNLRQHADELQDRYVPAGRLSRDRHVDVLLLDSLLSVERARRLAEAAARTVTPHTTEIGWFAALARVSHPENAPAHHALLVRAAAIAEATMLPVRPELDAWARQYLARTLAQRASPAESARPGPGGAAYGRALPLCVGLAVLALVVAHSAGRLAPSLLTFTVAGLTGTTVAWFGASTYRRSQLGYVCALLALAGLGGTALGVLVLVVLPGSYPLAWWIWALVQLAACWAALVTGRRLVRRVRPRRRR